MFENLRKTFVWFVISAAFIGPGTVTTATSAGANFGPSLLWTIVFAIIACILLQEGAARINIASGLSLGEAIVQQFASRKKNNGVALAITISVILGCAAYEAGNILGAVSGISLTSGINSKLATSGIIMLAGVLLYINKFRLITNFLATIIGIMGLSLLIVALTLDLDYLTITKGLILPQIPAGAELLTLGLIGTTVVPYNLFLGSRLAKGQELRAMRKGLIASVIVGGLISISLIMIGSTVAGEFSFENVALALNKVAGPWAIYFFAFGLFAAGITSAITAPWAASITLTSTLKVKNKDRAFFLTWLLVLVTGFIFGISEVKPIPMIILAQALNGVLLPFLAIAILFILNNKSIMQDQINGYVTNLLLLIVVWVTGILGLINIVKAFFTIIGNHRIIDNTILLVLAAISLLLSLIIAFKVYRKAKIALQAPH